MKRYKWYSILIIWLVVLLASSVVNCTSNPLYIYENGALQVGGDGEPIELTNNPDATNPTYGELLAFIQEDSTDTNDYLENPYIGYVCADFAEDVHNNAEAAGIRAAWVSINFEGSDVGHAVNAFETTDLSLVYIDCTGASFSNKLNLRFVETDEGFSFEDEGPNNWDAVAYIEIGKEYGQIPIDKAKSLLYSSYEEYKQEWQEYKELLSEYNSDVEQYNQEIKGQVYTQGSPELARIEAWKARLKKQSKIINKLSEELGNVWFKPKGIVKDIHIYWGKS